MRVLSSDRVLGDKLCNYYLNIIANKKQHGLHVVYVVPGIMYASLCTTSTSTQETSGKVFSQTFVDGNWWRYAVSYLLARVRLWLIPDLITCSHTFWAQASSHVYDALSNFWAQTQPVWAWVWVWDEPMKDSYYARGSHAFLLEPFPLALI